MGGIFISYRRDDSTGHVHALRDRLAARFGSDQIFMDIDSIEPGLDFIEVIENSIASCSVVLALIGKRWLPSERLQNSRDFVRLEIQAALDRKIRVIPVLLDGAQMPEAEDLPELLSPFSRRQAFEVSNRHYGEDLGRLVDLIGKIVATAPPSPPIQEPVETTATVPGEELLDTLPGTDEIREEPTGSPSERPKTPKDSIVYAIFGITATVLSVASIPCQLLTTLFLPTIFHETWQDNNELIAVCIVTCLLLAWALYLKIRKSKMASKALISVALLQFAVASSFAAAGVISSETAPALVGIYGVFAIALFFLARRPNGSNEAQNIGQENLRSPDP